MKTSSKTLRATPTLSIVAALLCLAPLAAQAQFNFTTNNDTITITRYYGPASDVVIPATINTLPVIGIGSQVFSTRPDVTSLAIPATVTNIAGDAFRGCIGMTAITVDPLNPSYSSLGGVLFNKSQTTLIEYPGANPTMDYTVPNTVTNIENNSLYGCSNLANVTIGTSVITIEDFAFAYCTRLTNVTLPSSTTLIGPRAFLSCISLTGVCFQGNPPSLGASVFAGATHATVYYRPGTSGWGPTFGGLPTALWYLPNPLILNLPPAFGMQTNGVGFIISWATNASVTVETCTNLVTPVWSPLATNALTDGWSYFSDPDWTNCPTRFYRIRSP